MARKNHNTEKMLVERKNKIVTNGNIGIVDDIYSLFRESIVKLMEEAS